jgi:hypothetical protein
MTDRELLELAAKAAEPEALRLAEMFDSLKLTVVGAQNALPMEEAATELRRLHEVNRELVEALEALDDCRGPFPASDEEINSAWKMVNAALAKARGTE